MTAPPALAPTPTLSGEQITAGQGYDLTTRNGQRRYLCDELGVTQRQARLLITAYVLDERDREARQASHEEFGNWLASNYWRALRGGIYGATT